MLSQISRTNNYARKYQRTLLVETESNPKFGAPLSKYFDLMNSLREIGASELYKFDAWPCFPPQLTGRLANYEIASMAAVPFCDKRSGVPVTFDFRRDYSEPILVHHQPGGGLNSVETLERWRFSTRILEEVSRRKRLLGRHYFAVHIRNTDYQTDWLPQLANLKERINETPCFIATDSREILESEIWRDLGIDARFSNDFSKSNESFDNNELTLIDLALLAGASEFQILKLSHESVIYSGYSLLAKYLWSVQKLKRQGLGSLLSSKSLFTDFHHSKQKYVRLAFFYVLWLPRIIRSSRTSRLMD
jgi:hypothetical protein